MLRNLICLLTCSLTLIAYSQDEIGSFQNSLKTSSSNIKDVIPIVNQETGELAMFIADAKNVYGYKLDESFNVQAKLSSAEKRRKYKLLIGSSASANGDYLVFLSNKNKQKFLCLNFSFDSQKTTEKEFTFQEKKESLLQTVSINNKFYIFSFHTLKAKVFLYTFDDKGDPSRRELDFSEFKFANNLGKTVGFKTMVAPTSNKGTLSKFFENDPQSIESVSVLKKMYIRDGKVIFTFDQNKSYTQVATVDLNTFELETKQFLKPLSNMPTSGKRTNSYLNGDYIFLSAGTKERYVLKILDYETAAVVNSYSIYKDKPIDFKNTPIIQEGGAYASYRELEKTKKFLRKINQGKIGISVLKRDSGYELTLGGFKPTGGGGPFFMPGFGLPIASMGNVTVFFNPTALAYNSYSATKSTRIECLFDQDFNHMQGEIQDNAFDIMGDYESPVEKAETVFKYLDFYVKGLYDGRTKTYTFRKFTN